MNLNFKNFFFQSSYFARLWKTLGLENVLINYYAIGNYGWTEKFILYSKKVFWKEIQGHNSRESKETSGGFVKTWQILPKTKCKSLLPSFTKSYQIVTFTEHSTLLSISGFVLDEKVQGNRLGHRLGKIITLVSEIISC